jgi:hypothetical protein
LNLGNIPIFLFFLEGGKEEALERLKIGSLFWCQEREKNLLENVV